MGKTGYTTIVVEKDKLSENPQIRTELLDIFAARGVTINNILSGIDALNIIVHESEVKDCEKELTAEIERKIKPNRLAVTHDIAMIAIVGRELGTSPAIAVKVLGALANRKININLIDHGSEKINMLIGVNGGDYIPAIQAIYTEFTRM